MRLYRARVMHRRLWPVRYRFAYRVFHLLLDVDRIEQDARALRLFSHNRFNLISFHDRDLGPRDGSPLRPWIERVLADEAGIALDGGRVQVLCMPRVLGFGFNPISVWYCQHRDGRLLAVLCEVHNTFGEAHGYLIHARGQALSWPVRATKAKCFHVSPLIAMRGEYRFCISAPGRDASVVISEFQQGRVLLNAAWRGRDGALSDRALAGACIAMPFMTLKVVAMIHWQALLAWLRGAPFVRKPPPPEHGIS